MPETKKPAITYTSLRVHRSDLVAVGAIEDELSEEKHDHSIVLRWSQQKWVQNSWDEATVSLVSIHDGTPKLLAIAASGYVKIFLMPGFAEESVDSGSDGPAATLPLRTARSIGGRVFAAGMARQVYLRGSDGAWRRIDQGVFVPRSERKQSVGFLAIDGTSAESVVAVGYKGEIWHFDGTRWSQQDSPTNLALTTLRVASSGDFVIAGLAGTILRGDRGRWRAIEQKVTKDDFWGSAVFRGAIYLATRSSVYRMDGDQLEKVSWELPVSTTAGELDSNDEYIWSAGSKHLARSADGIRWELISGPV